MSQDKITKIVKEINTLKTSCEKLNAQLEELITQKVENEMLLEEVKNLEDDAVLHKLVGLILVKEEKNKCYDTVTRRIHYISGEIESRKKVISNSEEKLKKLFSDLEMQSNQRKIAIPPT
ncbi:prefoldin subunit 6 [Plasmodium brasilianum]|uniref:Prefoldin subunit, putative n=2 Tax=Plasmodium (Plasmodium) TaxID=418103 RepID=A0A1C3KDT1_PLAMA|nr:prefoldin subunit, putative [Plasmodium malariae]KAI4837855.1 prefoldin subunit 6 [Plasmodium brasilianum]SBT71759.1 prefoldin subunit, putative [Plasmodium malariae]SCN44954.1 prefoldin subunit, putative [Plasmodium malariae]